MPYSNGNTPSTRVLIVSNRLPVTIRHSAEGGFSVERSSGGLATALSHTHTELDSLWIGWPGGHFKVGEPRKRLTHLLREEHRCVPVFLSAQAIQRYYYGFSNRALWPLFHSFQSYLVYNEEEWEAYVHANQVFCEAVLAEAQSQDVIWVQDYHLFLLPGMLRQYLPDARIGFFLHTPFPPSEMFRVLPCREAIVRGLLGADLLGFQTFSYMQNFLWAVYRVLGIDVEMGYLPYGGRQVGCEVHPIGIDPQQFLQAIHGDPATAREIERLNASIGTRKLLLGMDRLDYSKGIPARLRAYKRFLDHHPEWRERISMIQVAVPSREQVVAYQNLKRQVDELVGEINGVYGTTTWTPLQYVHRNLPFHEICALLRRADVALVTPLRDGMNLVAKEYAACQENRPGALILSEFAGASAEMGEAFFVNPYDEEGMGERIAEVLALSEDHCLERMTALHRRICARNVHLWAEKFLSTLRNVQHSKRTRPLTTRERQQLLVTYARASRRVLLLDYDGTLTPLVPMRQRAFPTPQLLAVLRALHGDPRNLVAVISGRDRHTLEQWLGDSGCILVAEHGAWFREGTGRAWRTIRSELNDDWKATIRPLLEHVVEQTPGSSLEEKDFSMVWHYRMADPEFGLWQARELYSQLQGMLASTGLQVQNGNKIVEVKWADVHAGKVASHLLERVPQSDFILAIGDDRTDEDVFVTIPPEQWSIKVGTGFSAARFSLSTPAEVLDLLLDLARPPLEWH